jgi:hypothetical protein
MGGKPRATRGARHQPLRVDVEGGRLIISIGVETLAFSVEHAPGPPLTVYDAETRDFVHTQVNDPDAFASEVRGALLAEEEDGSTLLDRMLDEAAADAVGDGCEGVDHGGDA